jgi:mRNA-degrading endonuclease RelE of RelBE toxin-antitoxin system
MYTLWWRRASFREPWTSVVPYRLDFSPDTVSHIRALPAPLRAIVLDSIGSQLRHEPTVETRHRKPMRPNAIACWELRVGTCRVYYDVSEEPEPVVTVLAIGIKVRTRVVIAGEEIDL